MNFLFVYLLYSKNDYNSTDTSVEGNLRVVIYISDYCVGFKYSLSTLIKSYVLSVHNFLKCSLFLNEMVLKIIEISNINKEKSK